MLKIYELCNWFASFVLISLSVILGTTIGGIAFGVIPALRCGINTLDNLLVDQNNHTATKILRIYWKHFFPEMKRAFKFSLLLFSASILFLFGAINTNQVGVLLIVNCFFFIGIVFTFFSAVIQPIDRDSKRYIFLFTSTSKVVSALLVTIIWLFTTFATKLPLYLFSIGLLCYSFMIIRKTNF